MPFLILKREKGWADRYRSYKILLDGIKIAKIKRGEELRLPIDVGQHSLQAKIDMCCSRPISITVSQRDVSIAVKSGIAKSDIKNSPELLTLLFTFYRRREWIILEQENSSSGLPSPNTNGKTAKPVFNTEDAAIIQKIMKICLAVLPFILIILSVGTIALDKESLALQIINAVSAVAMIGLSYFWCRLDSVVNDYPFGKYMIALFILALPLGIVIHLYRSRGFKKGSIALIKLTAYLAVILLVATAIGMATCHFLQIPIKDAFS
jgi:hypothetical protein